MSRKMITIDGNEAAASVAYRLCEVAAIYPITPSSNMGEHADAWAATGRPNIWGMVPDVMEMQSEGGAAGAIHGALQTGALATTFTASQGLLLMLPNMFKIAGELTPTVFHVSARTIATHALSIFGDHSDVMTARTTGWGMLASAAVQQAHDMALIATAASLESQVPFVHFFDGFRTSHEVQKIHPLSDEDLRAMIKPEWIERLRARKLTPDQPVIRGTAQNPDVFFQARERANPYYAATPAIVQSAMDRFAELTGRRYRIFDYHGAPDAERVIVIMGSGAGAAVETVEALNRAGEKVGMVVVRLFRPFDGAAMVAALPESVKHIAVLDRTKEPGAAGEPLYQDVITSLAEAMADGRIQSMPKVIGGRYGLSSKEFTPAMVKGVFDNLASSEPTRQFTVGIRDDVTNRSLDYDPSFTVEPNDVIRALFYGLGADGTVGANKNSIKIIGEDTDNWAQGYFVYDSKKSGSMTISHLRFGPSRIRSTYLIDQAQFVACHNPTFLGRYEMVERLMEGGTFLLNAPWTLEEAWERLPGKVQREIIDKGIKFYLIDGYRVAREIGLGHRINTLMQTCFFAISGVLPRDQAIDAIKQAIVKTYGAKGDRVIKMNFMAVDSALENLHEVKVPATANGKVNGTAAVPAEAPEFVQKFTAEVIAGRGDDLPVSAMPCDGTFPTATAQWERRNIAQDLPVWDPEICIQCGKCALVCPHATIRIKVADASVAQTAPETFKWAPVRGKDLGENKVMSIQVAPEDCTGCALCAEVCPVKNKRETRLKALNMAPKDGILEPEKENWEFFKTLPDFDPAVLQVNSVKTSQLLRPLFEFSGACSGCGETPYLKLVSQLFGDRTIIANATGCASIYGGNLPTTPWSQDASGRGPAWSNSLFEDNAEFGLGYRLTLDKHRQFACELVEKLRGELGDELADGLLGADQSTSAGIAGQRGHVEKLKAKLGTMESFDASQLLNIADSLVKKSVWIVGGDGWAYDIGFGGLDHVLASGRNVNVLVLDTEVYSNTGGQKSKSTPRAAVAKFAFAGNPAAKKNLALMAMSYGNVYVAQIAMGANDSQTVRAIQEAESYDGPSLIIAYSHCIAHGYDLRHGLTQQKAAVESGHFPLMRYDPRRAEAGDNPLKMDSKAPKISFEQFAGRETRFSMLTKSMPERASELMAAGQRDARARYRMYEQLASLQAEGPSLVEEAEAASKA